MCMYWQAQPVTSDQALFYANQGEKLLSELNTLVSKHDLLKRAPGERYVVFLPNKSTMFACTHGFVASQLWKLYMCVIRAKADAGLGAEIPRQIESFLPPALLVQHASH